MENKVFKDKNGREIQPGDDLMVMGKPAKAIIFEGEFGYSMIGHWNGFTFDPFMEDLMLIEKIEVISPATSKPSNQV